MNGISRSVSHALSTLPQEGVYDLHPIPFFFLHHQHTLRASQLGIKSFLTYIYYII